MSYYASGSGTVVCKKGVTKQEVEEALEDIETDIDYDILALTNGIVEIHFYESGRWDQNDTYEFLDELIPFAKEGIADYESHEDSSVWRYVLKEGEWVEENATIDYNFESYSDEDLINELKRRGYKNTDELEKETDDYEK